MHRRVVAHAPNHADAHNNLATTLSKQERWDEALPECEIAVRLEPTRAEFHSNLGNVWAALENWKEAAAALEHSASLAPRNADVHANLGIALYRFGQREQAAAVHGIATELCPDNARIWANLAAVQIDMDDVDTAQESCRRALEIDAGLPEVHDAIGNLHRVRGMPMEAIAAFEEAIRLRPDYHKSYNNLGIVFHSQGRFSEALEAYDRSVALASEYAQARWNRGLLHLLLGELGAGWRGYECGLDVKRSRARFRGYKFPLWQGSRLDGKTILVSGEQGVGDQIMFASLLPDLVSGGAKVVAVLEDRMRPLLERSMPEIILIPTDDRTASRIGQAGIDYQAPIGSLCRWLRPDAASFPKRRGYLKADAARVFSLRTRYRKRLGERPLVGVSWRGGSGEAAKARSIVLSAWAPILGQRHLGFVSLQYGDCRTEIATVERGLGAEILYDEEIDPLKSLDDFAAQTAAMDLVISIDNSTVHMAGALGVPAWVLLPAVPDWRWMLGRADSPWYSSVRLFRQSKAGEWSPVIAAVAEEMVRIFGATPSDGAADDRTDPGALR
jgi:tetratricopeptide (TPR) repeat protein/ADP-heptose:LPS heptosyltransferase